MTATAAAITSVNASLAANAAADADQAHIERCKAELLVFKKETATIEQTQSYASCVLKIHPVRTDAEISSMKAIVLLFLALFFFGVIFGVKNEWHGTITDKIFIGFLSGILGVFSGLIALAICLAVKFVIS